MTIKAFPGLNAKQSRVVRHTGYRLATKTERLVAEKRPIVRQKVKSGLLFILKAFWVGFLFLVKGIFGLIRKYPRVTLALVASAIAVWIAIWRYNQGFTTEDKFFLAVGLAFFLVGLRFTRRVLKENAIRYTPIGGGVALGGAWMLYLGFF